MTDRAKGGDGDAMDGRVKVGEVAEHEPQRVADLAVPLRHFLWTSGGHRQLVGGQHEEDASGGMAGRGDGPTMTGPRVMSVEYSVDAVHRRSTSTP